MGFSAQKQSISRNTRGSEEPPNEYTGAVGDTMGEEWLELSEGLKGEVELEITGGQGEIRTNCKADCYFRNGCFYLLFQENIAEDGKKGKLTFSSRLKISREQVVLHRSVVGEDGKSKKVMDITYRELLPQERGQVIDYPTPYGSLQLELYTKELTVELREGQLQADIAYRLLQGEQEAAVDRIRIRAIKPVSQV